MGSSPSKAATKAVQSTTKNINRSARKYPTHSPQTSSSPSSSSSPSPSSPPTSSTSAPPNLENPVADIGPTVHPPPRASSSKNYGIERDAQDPTLNPGLHARLAQLGPVKPAPTQSNSSTVSQFQFQSPYKSSHTPSSSSSSSPSSPSDNKDPNSILSTLSPTAFQPSLSSPTQSIFPSTAPSSNPAVSLLTARYRLTEEAEQEFANVGKRSAEGRRFLDVSLIRQVLVLRERGVREEEIERLLGLGRGVVGVLGVRGVVGVAGGE